MLEGCIRLAISIGLHWPNLLASGWTVSATGRAVSDIRYGLTCKALMHTDY